jgi:hypothetical protein
MILSTGPTSSHVLARPSHDSLPSRVDHLQPRNIRYSTQIQRAELCSDLVRIAE